MLMGTLLASGRSRARPSRLHSQDFPHDFRASSLLPVPECPLLMKDRRANRLSLLSASLKETTFPLLSFRNLKGVYISLKIP